MPERLPTELLGRTGLPVTRLGYGAAHRKSMDDGQMKVQLNTILDSGINFIDTADDYGNSEDMIGKYISHRRSEFYLATKCGSSESGHTWTKENVFRNLHESLRRMKTDYVDVMQLHNPTVLECQQGNVVDALEEMKQQGKVRWIGISTTLPDLPTYLKWGVFDTFQIPYSALERIHEEWITKSAQAGIGILIRGGVALGEPGIGLGNTESWLKFDKAGLDDLRQEGESRTAFVLRFTLTHPQSHTIITGTTNPNHLRENVQAILRGPLSSCTYEEAKRRLDSANERVSPVT